MSVECTFTHTHIYVCVLFNSALIQTLSQLPCIFLSRGFLMCDNMIFCGLYTVLKSGCVVLAGMYACMYVCMHVCMYERMYVCVCVYVCIFVCMIALLFDRVTKSPDSVSSTFVATLCICPLALMGLQKGLAILIASLIGVAFGTIATIIRESITTDMDAVTNSHLITVPIAIMLTEYTLYLFNCGDAGSKTSAHFSALFVILVPFEYVDISYSPLSTLLVRGVALVTAVISMYCGAQDKAFARFLTSNHTLYLSLTHSLTPHSYVLGAGAIIVNAIISGSWSKSGLSRRLKSIERKVNMNIQLLQTHPVHPVSQGIFALMTSFLGVCCRLFVWGVLSVLLTFGEYTVSRLSGLAGA